MMRNLFVGLFVSHGSPMILGGDEWIRTQFGNNNAYSDSSDNEWNWFRWGEWQSTYACDRYRMHDFVRGLIAFRKARTYALSPAEYGGGMPLYWKNASNGDIECWEWGEKRHVAMHYVAEGDFADKAGLYPQLRSGLDRLQRGYLPAFFNDSRKHARGYGAGGKMGRQNFTGTIQPRAFRQISNASPRLPEERHCGKALRPCGERREFSGPGVVRE